MSIYAQSGANLVLVPYAKNETMEAPEKIKNLFVSESERLCIGVVSACAGVGESTTDGVYSGRCLIVEKGIILSENKPFSLKPCFGQLDFEFLNAEKVKKGVVPALLTVKTVNFNY